MEKGKYNILNFKLYYIIQGNIYQKIVDISTEEKREKKIEELEKRIRKKANKKLFGTVGAKIPIGMARDELYYELKNIWYGKAV